MSSRSSSTTSSSSGGAATAAATGPTWEMLKELGNTAFKAGRFTEAITHYAAAIELKPSEATLYSNRSAAFLKLHSYSEAAADAERAIELDPGFVKAYTRLHTAYCTQGRFDVAHSRLTSGIAAVGARADAAQLRDLRAAAESARAAVVAIDAARVHLDQGEYSLAKSRLAAIGRSFPDCDSITILRAQADAPVTPDAARAALAAIAHRHASNAEFLLARALALYYGGGVNGLGNAQKVARELLSQDPDNSRAQRLLKRVRAVEASREAGNAAYKEKRFQEAVDRYTDAISSDVANVRLNSVLRGNRAAAYMELKKFDLARVDCDFAINNGNDAAKMYARRSRIHEQLGNWDDAQRDMQHAAEREDSFRSELHQLKVRVKRSKRKDYYKILGVEHSADDAALKRAYRKAALQWHPDKWAHSSEEEKTAAEIKFKELGEAHAVLSDPRKRRMYDNGQLDNDVEGDHGGMGGMGGGGMDADIMQMFSSMMMGGGGMGGMGGGGFPGRGAGGRGARRGGPPPGFAFSFN